MLVLNEGEKNDCNAAKLSYQKIFQNLKFIDFLLNSFKALLRLQLIQSVRIQSVLCKVACVDNSRGLKITVVRRTEV